MIATDWIRLLVREEGRNSGVMKATLKALDSIAMKPEMSCLCAPARLVNAFRTTVVDPTTDGGNIFSRYVREHDLKQLMERLA